MLDDKKASQAQLAMERLGRPLSSYPRTGKIARTISYADKARLDRAIEPKIRQNGIERRESMESAEGIVLGGSSSICEQPKKLIKSLEKDKNQ